MRLLPALLTIAVLLGALPARGEPVKVFVIAGQSNAQGYGDGEALPPELASQPGVLYDFWSSKARVPGGDFSHVISTDWEPLAPKELQPGSSTTYGPEITFGAALETAFGAGGQVAILKATGPGTNLVEHWGRGLPPDPKYPEKSQLYHLLLGELDSGDTSNLAYRSETTRLDTALARLDASGESYELAALIWMQGENEAAWNAAFQYEARLREFLIAVREDLGLPQLPVVITRLSDNVYSYNGGPFSPAQDAGVDAVRAAQEAVAADDDAVVLVDTDDLEPSPDTNLHFTSEGYQELGVRLANAYLALDPPGEGGAGQGGAAPVGGASAEGGGQPGGSGQGANAEGGAAASGDDGGSGACDCQIGRSGRGSSAALLALALGVLARGVSARGRRRSRGSARRS